MCMLKTLKHGFVNRGYPHYLVKEHVEKALRLTPSDEINTKK